ncbi:Hypothetical predicted protein [Mytilus galloprovincialis]|uniref:Uncharacterized protein n=1 Tax=Mytilus galloprovincialis TaxID=29158 RepID=A0A8B6G2H3_MYTGA|nr:Hypothetical predicted protein [Mytilus galloprovincialis]
MTKKKAIRVGHRGAARRLISKIEEELEKETTQRDEIESLCETLKKKRDILSELDNEILEEIAEENMEAEIEDSDRYVLDIERILTKVRNSSSSKQKNKSNETSSNQNLNPNAADFLPSDVRKNITRDRGNDDWDIESLRTAIKREVCVQVAGQSTGTSNEDLEILPTASFIAETFPERTENSHCGKRHHTSIHVQVHNTEPKSLTENQYSTQKTVAHTAVEETPLELTTSLHSTV